MKVLFALLVGPLISFVMPQPLQAGNQTLIEITTSRGAKQTILLLKPERPIAIVLLFPGGHGALGLKASSMRWGEKNFLVRSREQFASRGLMVAVMDAPSDHWKGMSAIFRMSAKHAADITSVVRHLRKQADLPVWVIGTSMGTFSSANAAIHSQGVDGLVLTSTITRAKPQWKIKNSHREGVASMDLEDVKVPTLIVAHKDDHCPITPASGGAKLKMRLKNARKVEVVLLDGGDEPRSEPCQALSQHGFLGIERQAVDAIAAFIRAKGKSTE